MASDEIMYDITGGDSKDKLLCQLGDIGRVKGNRPTMTLKVYRRGAEIVEDPTRMKFHGDIHVCINGLEAEDGSGNCWIIRGYLADYDDSMNFESDAMNFFEGFYNTNTRKGWLRPRSN